MNKDRPIVSIIIPTHNRRDSLLRSLDALGAQSYSMENMEVIVVADGCTDNTVDVVRSYVAPFALHILDQPPKGPSIARNKGVERAAGQLLIFLDDDVEACPLLVEAHVRVHELKLNSVAIGYYKPKVQTPLDFFRSELRLWWEKMFYPMFGRGHRYTYRDVLTGNLSLEKRLFTKIGGFDPMLGRQEDHEFGIRIIDKNIPLTFVPEALGIHHEQSTMDKSFRVKYEEGKADVYLARRHPRITSVLPLSKPRTPSLLNQILRNLAFNQPKTGRFLAALLRKELNLLERVRLRQHWRRLLHQLLDYWYWRGVAEKVQDKKKLHDLLKESKAKSTVHISKIEIDLQQGLEVAERMLDEIRPHSAIFRFGDHPVGKIPYEPGAERLRATHLRPFLATTLSWQLLTAMQRQLLLDYFDGDSGGLRRHRLCEDQTVFTQLTGPACVHQSGKKNDDSPDTRTHLSPGNILDYVER